MRYRTSAPPSRVNSSIGRKRPYEYQVSNRDEAAQPGGLIFFADVPAADVEKPFQSWHRQRPDELVELILRVAGWLPHPGWGAL